MAELEDRVKAAYRRHYESTKNWTEAWNRTLVEIAGPYDADTSEPSHEVRQKVVQILIKAKRQVELEVGDSFSMAVEAALRDLRRDKAAQYVQTQWRIADEQQREQIRKDKKLDLPKGPKEWSPRKEKREEEVERIVEHERETSGGSDDMTLYITFDDKGALQGWTVDYPSYWQGHGGPTAYVLASDSLDYDEIQSAIEEALGDLDWDEIQEELEEDDHE